MLHKNEFYLFSPRKFTIILMKLSLNSGLSPTEARNIFFKNFTAKYHDAVQDVLDDDVIDYICDSIADAEDQTATVTEILTSFCPELKLEASDIPEIIRASEVLKTPNHRINYKLVGARPASSPPSEFQSVPAIVEAADSPEASSTPVAPLFSESDVENISYICSMFPDIDLDIIEYVYLNKCARNKEPTVLYLLEECSDPEGIERHRMKLQIIRIKEEEDRLRRLNEAKSIQAAVFERYGDQEIKEPQKRKPAAKGTADAVLIENTLRDDSKSSKV
jgi:hypothetical protein